MSVCLIRGLWKDSRRLNHNFKPLHRNVKFDYTFRHVCPSEWNKYDVTKQIFTKDNVCKFFDYLSRNLKNLCILKRMPLILHKGRYAFIIISLLFYKKWETFEVNILSKTKKPNSVVNHFWQHFSMCNNTKNTTDETSHMLKYNTVQACSVLETSSTNTHSEY